MYSLFVDMEKRLGWDNLIKLRSTIFMLDSETVSQAYDQSSDFPSTVIVASEGSLNPIESSTNDQR